MQLIAFNYKGEHADPATLLARYTAKISPPPLAGPAMPVAVIREVFGRALIETAVPNGYLVRMVIPGEDKAHATNGGVFTIPIDTEDHTYYPLGNNDKRGLFGFGVAGVNSEYIDGIGCAFGQYDDDVSKYPPASVGNNYGHLEASFVWDAGAPAPVSPAPVAPGAMPEALITRLFKLRQMVIAADDEISDIVNTYGTGRAR